MKVLSVLAVVFHRMAGEDFLAKCRVPQEAESRHLVHQIAVHLVLDHRHEHDQPGKPGDDGEQLKQHLGSRVLGGSGGDTSLPTLGTAGSGVVAVPLGRWQASFPLEFSPSIRPDGASFFSRESLPFSVGAAFRARGGVRTGAGQPACPAAVAGTAYQFRR